MDFAALVLERVTKSTLQPAANFFGLYALRSFSKIHLLMGFLA